MKKNIISNIPNLLSLLRILLTPVALWAFFHWPAWLFVLIFALASSTDFFDGLIARKYQLVSKTGMILDVVGDKLLVLSVLLAFIVQGDLRLIHFLLMSSREIVVIVGKLLLFSKIKTSAALTEIPPSKLSKFTTLIFFVTVCAIAIDWNRLPFIYLSIFLSLASSVQYLVMGVRHFRSKK